jgi:alpha-tubulin suppressor-like RCC1 family protein
VGDGQKGFRTAPTKVVGTARFAHIYAGQSQSCGLTAQGAAYCWGTIEQMRAQEDVVEKPEPTKLDTTIPFASLAIGRTHKCGLAKDGKAWCWGMNGFGQLGDGSAEDRAAPTAVKTDQTFRTLAAGAFHTCGGTAAGEIFCWGRDLSAQFTPAPKTVAEPTLVKGPVFAQPSARRSNSEN